MTGLMTYIISIGGSSIVPEKIDTVFLKNFRRAIIAASKNSSFLIIPGGGATVRMYQKAAQGLAKTSHADLDWIGITTNVMHSHFLRAIFGKQAHEKVIFLDSRGKIKKPIAIAQGGFKPGATSDGMAVMFAKKYKIRTIVNMTNVAGVYDKDPRKFKTARLIPRMTWKDLKAQFGTGTKPGRKLPFDSAIAGTAEKLKLKVVTLDSHDLKNFRNFLAGKNFKGTVIQ